MWQTNNTASLVLWASVVLPIPQLQSNTYSLYVTLNDILQTFKHPRLCRHDPTLFLAHCKAHKTPTQSQPCKELKMLTHSPPTPADEYLSTLVQHFGNLSLLSTKPAHHPAYETVIRFTDNMNRTITISKHMETGL